MTLADYLAQKDLSPAQFARMIGKPASTITRLLRGERRPRFDTLQAITEATGGAVTPRDFAPLKTPSDATVVAAQEPVFPNS